MKIVLDTNCLLDAADENTLPYLPLQKLLAAAASGKIKIFVSRHSLSELTKDSPITERAKAIANSLPVLPHYPIATWNEQVATWDQLSGTWDDARHNQEIQIELTSLAKSGNDIRDRGAYIDALLARVDVFITSDKDLVGGGPARRIQDRFGLWVITPEIADKKLI